MPESLGAPGDDHARSSSHSRRWLIATVGARVTTVDDGELAELSRLWVERLAARLEVDGRRLEGGWPGTLSEARSLLAEHLRGARAELDRDAREGLARAIYALARTRWLSVAARCSPLPAAE